MAVKLRLKRMGSKRRPFYRVVASDARSPRDGRFIEVVGTYNPITNPAEISMKEDKVMYWLSNGAIPTDTVKNLLSKTGMLKKFAESKAKAPKKEVAKKETVKKAPAKKEEAKTETKKAPAKKATATKTTATKKTTAAKKPTTAKKTTKKEDK